MKNKVIKTKDFILRPLYLRDAEAVAKHAHNPVISRNMLIFPYPYKKKDAQKWLRRVVNNRRKKKPASIIFGIEIDGGIVGSIGWPGVAYRS